MSRTPWTRGSETSDGWMIYGNDRNLIAIVPLLDDARENAKLIVRAVNSHANLLEALTLAEEWISAMCTVMRIETCPIINDNGCTGLEEVQDGLNRIRAAIANAAEVSPVTLDTQSPTT